MVEVELAFENFLMTQKLDDLLKIISQEVDEHKKIKIERVIYLKINYMDDNNRKLNWITKYLHIREIKKMYKNTEYEKYLKFNKSLKSKKLIFASLIFMGFIIGGYIYKEIDNYKFSNKSYVYKGIKLPEEKYMTLFNAKIKLIELYLRQGKVAAVYKNYNEALEIESKFSKASKKRENKLALAKENLVKLIMIDLEDEDYGSEDFAKKSNEYLKIAESIGELSIQSKLYEIQGDLALKEFSLIKARNLYVLSSRLVENGDNLKLKAALVTKFIKVNSMLDEVKILQLQNKNEEALEKYKEAITLYEVGEDKRKISQLDEKIESIKGEIKL